MNDWCLLIEEPRKEMTNNPVRRFHFPVGYHRFHKNPLFNFQLNRWFSLGYVRFEDMEQAGKKIKNFHGWKCTMLEMAEKAVAENRWMNAAFCYRAAEFYTSSKDPDKERLYDMFIDLFYKVFGKDGIERHAVPYEGAFLPVLRVPAAKGKKGIILMHGGFDSLIEEWYSMMRTFAYHGYDVIGFEGPGQGAAVRKYGLPLTFEWEKPVKAVLDHFRLDDVTLLGMSMGGWFGLRAAAFEPRIHRVIANGHAIDYMQSLNAVYRKLHVWFFEHCRDFMDRMAMMKMKREGIFAWMVEHLMYITKKEKPMDALELYFLLNERNIHPERVKQDVLVLASREDHFIPFKMHCRQLDALVHAKSVSDHVFTREDHAQNHCQTGNIGLALDVMVKWIDGKS
jgi:pimeloyl-ACP methyl ester carboxylesterase